MRRLVPLLVLAACSGSKQYYELTGEHGTFYARGSDLVPDGDGYVQFEDRVSHKAVRLHADRFVRREVSRASVRVKRAEYLTYTGNR